MASEPEKFENDEVGRLLGSLKHVEPPADFDFRVRGRIAAGRAGVRGAWLPTPARVTAAALVGLAAGYFGFRSMQTPPAQVEQAGIAPVSAPPQIAPLPAANAFSRPETVREEPPPTQPTTAAVNTKTPETPSKPINDERGGGSIDFTSGVKQTILPRGLDPDKKIDDDRGFQRQGIPVADVLSQLGIAAAASGAGWRVTSVTGRAARSGLLPGDVIEALGGRSLVKRTSLDGTVSGSSLRVRRDGKTLEITLQP